MITAGVDVGNKWSKVVILRNYEEIFKGYELSGFDQRKAAEDALKHALNEAGLKMKHLEQIFATGDGKTEVYFAGGTITDIGAAAKGVIRLFPRARTVIDVGVEGGRALKMDENGRVIDFAINDKCAAGAGAFVEAMARALEVSLEEMGSLSLQSTKLVPMNAQCAVFAESEVVSLIHLKTPKPDIVRAIHHAMASRVSSMVRRVGLQEELVMIGGVANNLGFVKALEEELETKVFLPVFQRASFVSALGAALAAAENIG